MPPAAAPNGGSGRIKRLLGNAERRLGPGGDLAFHREGSRLGD